MPDELELENNFEIETDLELQTFYVSKLGSVAISFNPYT